MRILIFLKAPRAGTVKTRLASSIGNPEALRVYKTLVKRQLSRLPPDSELEIHFTPADAASEIRNWLGPNLKYIPQCEGSLGDRLDHAVKHAFANGAVQVACIAADCPGLGAEHFQLAAETLEDAVDLVFGPTRDGGYYLIAMKAYHPELFSEIPWSSQETLSRSLLRARELNLRPVLLEELEDVDAEAGWRRAQNQYDLSTDNSARA